MATKKPVNESSSYEARRVSPYMVDVIADGHSTSPQSLLSYGVAPIEIRSDEAYMCDRHRTHFRTLLLHWKMSLLESGDQAIHELQLSGQVTADISDQASMEESFALTIRTRDRERRLITKIDEAIALIDAKQYGHCEDCGVEIGIRRLEARPTATLCIDCKSLQEIRERQGR